MANIVDKASKMLYVYIYNGILFAANIWMILVITSISTFLIRQAILPEYDTTDLPLNFHFKTCQDDLSGICSYPVAEVQLHDSDYRPILTPDTRHAVTLILSLDTEFLSNIRVFMVLLKMHDRTGKVTNIFPHSVNLPKLRKPPSSSLFDWLHFAFFWPLYIIGFYGHQTPNELIIEILLHKGYVDSSIAPTQKMSIELQNRYLPVEMATIKLTALFGLVRYVAFYYPVLSSLLIALAIGSMLATFSALFWARRSYFLIMPIADVIKTWRYPKSENMDQVMPLENSSIENQPTYRQIGDRNRSTDAFIRRASSKLLYDPDDPLNNYIKPYLRKRNIDNLKKME